MESAGPTPSPRCLKTAGRALAGLAVALAVVVILELLLGLLPLDRYESRFPGASYPVFVPGTGEYSGKYVTNPHFRTSLDFQAFARKKAPGTTRIFVLGSSAAKGWPGGEATAFTGFLRRALDAERPGAFEIVNVAGHSYASHRVLDVLYDVVDLDPDLVVLYSGNNEYVERNVLPPAARSRFALKIARVLRRSALYRTVRLGVHRLAPSLFDRPAGPDLTDLRAAPVTRLSAVRTPEADREVLEHYRENLAEISRVVRARGIRAIFCTVPVNLAKWAPALVPPEFVDKRAAERGRPVIREGFEKYRGGDYAAAAALLGSAIRTAPRYATAHYVRGDALRRLGRYEEAREELLAACEYDARPLRELPSFRQELLAAAAGRGISVVDLAVEFSRHSGANLVGLDLFLDYCHPNDAGHKLIARLVLDGLERLGGVPRVDADAVARRVAADNRSSMDLGSAHVNYALAMTQQNLGDLAAAERLYRECLRVDPSFPEALYNLGVIRYRSGDGKEAETLFLRSLAKNPELPASLYVMGTIRYREGRLAEAADYLSRLLRVDPERPDALEIMGDIAAGGKDWRSAKGYYARAQSSGGDGEALRRKIADVDAAAGTR